MWAAGVVMYTMLTGQLPFKGKDEKELHRKILVGKVQPLESGEARHLLRMMWVDRITAEMALKHPWFINK